MGPALMEERNGLGIKNCMAVSRATESLASSVSLASTGVSCVACKTVTLRWR